VKAWSDHAIGLLSGVNTAETMSAHMMAGLEFHLYVTALSQMPARTELMAALQQAREEEELSSAEVSSIVMQLLIAGSDSSASAMGSAVALLAEREDLRSRLRDDPAAIGAFVDEVLRLEAPFQGHFRVLTEDAEVGGVALKRGDRLMLLWGSANRDPSAFESPDEVRLDRPGGTRHLAFGHGLHHCLGAALGRLEARVVLDLMLDRVDDWSLAAPFRYRSSVFSRTIEALELRTRY